MAELTQYASARTESQPTILETELDSICLVLGQMKTRLQRLQMLEHLTDSEKTELEAALDRAEGRIVDLKQVIHG
jgi:hypothetical protein